ncbi:phosducin-like protein 3 [Temnothorax americanus]|uniref:phosducin-like protein 3 n=1 Tax=Temnothorax americanus TaxID=1964332 RepID=UPI0040690710
MEAVLEQNIKKVANHVEQQLDAELEKLDNLDISDYEKIRAHRLNELKRIQKQKQDWLASGHGEYAELYDEKEFFEVSKKSGNIACLFYKDDSPRCKIVDHHFKILAKKHIEARFCKLNVERCPFLTERLRIRIIPTIAIIVNGKTKDYIVGFTELGNCDDFSTETLQSRLAQSGVINYDDDLQCSETSKKPFIFRPKTKTIKGRSSDDSDDD